MSEKTKKIKFAFHVHSNASKDSLSSPEKIIEYCRRQGIDAIAICDHNSIEGAKQVKALSDGNPYVIICEEIKTTEGEIIGLFLSQKIPKGLTCMETIAKIREQKGLICLPHPGERLRRSAIKKVNVEKIIEQVDAVEVYNSRTIFSNDDRWAYQLAQKNNKIMLAGSDAHSVLSIGCALNQLNSFSDRKDFLISATNNDIIFKKKTGIIDQLISILIRFKKGKNA